MSKRGLARRLPPRAPLLKPLWAALTLALPLALTVNSHRAAQAASFLEGFGNSTGISPFQQWETLHTPHFKVHHPASLRETASLTARYFEEAHAVLAPLLAWEPEEPTTVLVFDPTDSANGLTTPLERFGILIYATPPESWFSTTRNDDWLRTLVTHEYVHTLTIDPTRGLWKTLRTLFGDVTLPNGTWPSWMLEGMAVYLESRLSTSGRGRSPTWEAILRAAVKEELLGKDDFLRLDQVNGGWPYYPEGEIPYLFGYHLISELAAQVPSDPEAPLRNLSIRGSQGIPYLLDQAAQAEVQLGWPELWSRWVGRTQRRHRANLKQLQEAAPLTELRFLPELPRNPHDQVRAPRRSRDGRWTLYTAEGPSRRSGLYVIDHHSKRTDRIDDQFLGAGAAFLPAAPAQEASSEGAIRFALTSRLDRRGGYSETSDLHLVDLESKTLTRLSTGLRARDPDISADGKTVVFAMTQDETVGLASAPLLGSAAEGTLHLGPITPLFFPEKRARVSQPQISPDGSRVIFSLHPARGSQESILEVHLSPESQPTAPSAGGTARTILSNGHYLRMPFFLSNDEIGFISDQTGVENLWSLKLADGAHPVLRTNVQTSLSFPALISTAYWPGATSARPQILAAALTGRGWKLAELTLSSEGALSENVLTLPAIPNSWEKAAPIPASEPGFIRPHEPPTIPETTRTYSAFQSLRPRSWITSLDLGDGNSRLNTQITGYDALEFWGYGITPGFDFLTAQPLGSVRLDWRGGGPTFRLQATSDTAGTSDSHFRDLSLKATVFHPFYFTTASWVPSLSVSSTRTFQRQEGETVGAATPVPTLDLKLFASNAETSRLAITAERGRSFETGVRASLLQLIGASESPSYKAYLRYQENLPLGAHWILKPSLRLSYATRLNTESLSTFTRVVGKAETWLSPFSSDGLDQISLRGYPGRTFLFRGVALPALDLRFPLARPFRGVGVAPAYFRDFYGSLFIESASALRSRGTWFHLPSAGLGITSRSTWLQGIPVDLSVEFHTGFRKELGGESQAFFQVQTGLPSL